MTVVIDPEIGGRSISVGMSIRRRSIAERDPSAIGGIDVARTNGLANYGSVGGVALRVNLTNIGSVAKLVCGVNCCGSLQESREKK